MNKSFKTINKPVAQEFENHLHLTEARWFAVYTGYKREKKAVEFLTRKGITAYLPLQQFTRHYTRKTRQVALPLISGYVFVKIAQPQYVPVLETHFVQYFLRIRRNLLAIPEAEIDLLRRIVGEGVNVEVETTGLHEGDEVEIIAGQLTGLRGVLVERLGRQKLVIALQTLGYDLLMEVSPGHLRKLQPGSLR